MDSKKLVSTQVLMNRYGVSRATITRWVRAGMPCEKLGYRTHRYDAKACDDWLEEQKRLRLIG